MKADTHKAQPRSPSDGEECPCKGVRCLRLGDRRPRLDDRLHVVNDMRDAVELVEVDAVLRPVFGRVDRLSACGRRIGRVEPVEAEGGREVHRRLVHRIEGDAPRAVGVPDLLVGTLCAGRLAFGRVLVVRALLGRVGRRAPVADGAPAAPGVRAVHEVHDQQPVGRVRAEERVRAVEGKTLPGGLEPPTLRLTAARSNQLS